MHAAHGAPPVVPGTHPQLRFGHFVGYAGTYYSYPYASCFAAALWQAQFAGDPLARGCGARVRRTLLEPGCSRPPGEVLMEVLPGALLEARDGGVMPDPSPFLAELGIKD